MEAFEEEHQHLVQLEDEGKLLIGVDRVMARHFWTDVPIRTIKEETGEAPYSEKAVAYLAELLGPAALIGSLVLAFPAFGWFGVICLVACPAFWFLYIGLSVRGAAGMSGITVLLVASVGMHVFAGVGAPWMTGFVILFVSSLWCMRFLYYASTFLLRCFVIRNARAFRYLSVSGCLVIRQLAP
jgi:hypothetical protein